MTDTLVTFAGHFVSLFTNLLSWAVLIYILLSWIMPQKTPLSKALANVVQPLLRPFRWAKWGGLDFSPVVLLLLIDGVRFIALKGLSLL